MKISPQHRRAGLITRGKDRHRKIGGKLFQGKRI